MAGTVTPLLTNISLCEATTGWSIESGCSGAPTLTPAPPDNINIQGSYSVYSYNAGGAARGHSYDLGGNTDLRNLNIYCWFSFSNKANIPVKGSTGMRLRIYDTAVRGTTWSEWDLFGSDTLPHGGWLPWVVNTSISPSRNGGGGAANLQTARWVGWICGGTVTGKTYIYHDAWRYGTGLNIKGGTSGTPTSLADLYTYDAANACGVIDKINGVYFVQGQLTIGSTTGGDATYFKDTSQAVVFKDGMIPDGFYDLKLQGNASANTEVYFGELTGGRGISGCLFRCQSPSQTPKFKITATDTNITKFGLYGCTILNAGIIAGQAYNADKQFVDCSIIASAAMEPNTGKVQYCNFISAAGSAIKLASTSHHTDYCNFISCVDGVELTAAGNAYTFSALMFSGCTYDVKFSASGTAYVTPTNSSNVSTHHETGGGTTTINYVQITLRINGLITGSDVVVYTAGTTTVLVSQQENSGTYYDYVYPSGDAGNNIDVGVFLAGYRPTYVRAYTLLSSNASLPIAQQIDRDYLV
jgi:hypothetical protein